MQTEFAQKPEAIKFSKGLKNIRSKGTLSRWLVTECKQCSKSVLSTLARYNRAKDIFCCIECKQQHIYDNRSKKTDCKVCGKKLKKGEGYRSSESKSKSYICDRCRMIGMANVLRNKISFLNKKTIKIDRIKYLIENAKKICVECGNTLSIHMIMKESEYCSGCKLRILHSTPHYLVNSRMTAGIKRALESGKKGRAWEKLVDYTIKDLMQRLESLFHNGMSWDNIGDWHIDHIIPKSSFDYNNEYDEGFRKAWALDNLQPLWGKDNAVKHTAMPGEDNFIRLEDWQDKDGNISELLLLSLRSEKL